MKYDFTTILDRAGRDSLAADAVPFDVQPDPGVRKIPMWVADMSFPAAPPIIEAIEKRLEMPNFGYFSLPDSYFDSIISWQQRRNGVTKLSREHIGYENGVLGGVSSAVQALTAPGEKILVHSPTYVGFTHTMADNGRVLVHSPLVRDENGVWRMDYADMDAKLKRHRIHLAILCSPHNPCGRAWSEEELTAVVALCRRYGAPIVCDEIHADFVYAPNTHHSILTIPGAREIAVMLCAASKTFNVAGLEQSAIVCCNEAVRKAIAEDMAASGVKAGNAFALAATRAAYTGCDAWLDGLMDYLAGSRDMVAAFVAERMPRVRLTPLEATYLMWLDCSALGFTQDELLARIRAAHVKVNDGLFFGEQGRGFIRLNIGCPRSQIREALTRLATVLG